MSFIQPFLLAALPLISLPIIIHLINQRRYQTMRWGAMMFLLAANKMARGYARLRQWLILLFRSLVIAGLVLAVSRPLASGWLGLAAGGRADTTIILLDRSSSMQQQGNGGVTSKLDTGRHQLVQVLNTLGSSRWVLIESTTTLPYELESPDALLTMPSTEPTSASADLPAMLQAAHDYIDENQSGRTEIWICTDLRENDWNAESGRWQILRDSFLEFTQGVRFHLLAYPQKATGDVAVRVTDVKRQTSNDGAELLLSLVLTREGDVDNNLKVPIHFEIDGARSELEIEMAGPRFELKDYRIAVDDDRESGWGRISIPADENPANNDFYFTFDKQPARRTIVVADDPQAAGPLQLAASISPDQAFQCVAEVVPIEQLAAVEWEQISLLLWQSDLPRDDDARLVESYVQRGGQVIFFPPHAPNNAEFFGVSWDSWTNVREQITVESWRGDQDLLAHTLSGAPLPVGELKIRKYCQLSGDVTQLATLRGGDPLIARVTTDDGGVYFCTTTTISGDSSLATDGIVLYISMQRALAVGASVLGNTRQLVAGDPKRDVTSWVRLAGADESLSTEYGFHRGVYADKDRLLAVNRDAAEDQSGVLTDDRVAGLFNGLDFARVDDQAGNINSLIQEIWRLFLATMMIAMITEAVLCIPKLRRAEGAAA